MATVVRREIRKRGPLGWIFIVLFWLFNLAMLAWLIGYWSIVGPSWESGSDAEQAGYAIGTMLGTGLILFFWVGGAVILGLFALLTRGRKTFVEDVAPRTAPRGRERFPDSSFHLGVAGESRMNRDGTGRQAIIARLRVGDAVRLVREPDNPHDEFAVRVDSRLGTIGYVPARNAPRLADELDAGAVSRATIDRIAGGGDEHYGVWLAVDLWFPDDGR